MTRPYFAYALKSVDHDWIYAGITDNLERRLSQHNHGANHSTKHYAPFFLFYSELFDTRTEARHREKYFKSAAGKRFLRKKLHEFLNNPDNL